MTNENQAQTASKKSQPVYSDEFREQLVKLVESGRKTSEVAKQYGVARTSVDSWVKKYHNSGSFRDADNRSAAEIELRELKKKLHQLQLEYDILKKAVAIMSRT